MEAGTLKIENCAAAAAAQVRCGGVLFCASLEKCGAFAYNGQGKERNQSGFEGIQ